MTQCTLHKYNWFRVANATYAHRVQNVTKTLKMPDANYLL